MNAQPLNARKRNTILAALRNWQHDIESGVIDPEESPIATDNGYLHPPLTSEEIDALCEDINTGTLCLKE